MHWKCCSQQTTRYLLKQLEAVHQPGANVQVLFRAG